MMGGTTEGRPGATPGTTSSLVDVGHAGAALDGLHSGDLHLVAPFPGGVLLALIDGLGHGREAGDAARCAADILAAHAEEPVIALVQRCHEALRKTRGAVMSVAALCVAGGPTPASPRHAGPADIAGGTRAPSPAGAHVTWLGVGNVEGVLLRGDRSVVPSSEGIQLRGGVVGYQLPPLRPTTVPVSRGDTLILASDGVQSSFTVGLALERSPQELADAIVRRHARGNDDTLVLVARYLGGHA
jgi:phosphoserine phosphatase RsbX